MTEIHICAYVRDRRWRSWRITPSRLTCAPVRASMLSITSNEPMHAEACRSTGATTVTVVVCGSHIVDALQQHVTRARAMLKAGAYVHWYVRYGVLPEGITRACDRVDMIAAAYLSATT